MKNSFAFVIHPRDISDTARKYQVMKFFPSFLNRIICRCAPPLIASEITGLKSGVDGEQIKGWLLICPLTTQQLLENPDLGRKRIRETVFLAEKLGAKIVGLGAITSSITHGGKDLVDEIKIGITNGRALTVGMTWVGVKEIARIKKVDLAQATVAIVGATGIIGKAISKVLIYDGVKKFILVAKREHFKDLIELKNALEKINPLLSIEISAEMTSIKKADIVIVATSSPEILINSSCLKTGAIVYDVTQPQNVSPRLVEERKDVLIIDGALVKTPGINYNFDLGLPPETIFACVAETMILAAEKRFNVRLVGDVEIENVKEILNLAKKYNFTHAPFTSFGKVIFL